MRDRFANRRRMAWQAWCAGLAGAFAFVLLGVLGGQSALSVIQTVVVPYYTFLAVPISWYFGCAAYEHAKDTGGSSAASAGR